MQRSIDYELASVGYIVRAGGMFPLKIYKIFFFNSFLEEICNCAVVHAYTFACWTIGNILSSFWSHKQ